ncbi:MAG: cyclic nucleotide-binding domain-containing protein [Actinomycetota bacterium]
MSKTPIDLLTTRSKPSTRGPVTPKPVASKVRRRSADALAGVPLFSGLSRRHLNQLADVVDEVRFRPGTAVIREGDLGQTLFVILEGQAKVTRGGRTLTKLGPGEFFGEISLLDRGPRTASVGAQTPLVTVRLFRREFLKLARSEPKMAERVLETLAGRLRAAEKLLTS